MAKAYVTRRINKLEAQERAASQLYTQLTGIVSAVETARVHVGELRLHGTGLTTARNLEALELLAQADAEATNKVLEFIRHELFHARRLAALG